MTPLAPREPREPSREPDLLHGLIHDRLRELAAARAIVHGRRADWTPGRWAIETEFRALVRLARSARRQAEADTVWHAPDLPVCQCYHAHALCIPGCHAEPEQADPLTAAKGYHDWTEAEMAYAAGR